ncbi:MAG: hypothetical protein ACR2IL_08720 [Chitinophagaceae bacterium]
MKEIIISNFELSYDGMYQIKWNNQEFEVFLPLKIILSIIAIEGINLEELQNKKAWESIHFSKASLTVWAEEENGQYYFKTSDFSENYMGRDNISLVDVRLQ